MQRVLALVLFVVFALGSAGTAFAGTTGNISGTITAATGAPIAGAKVTVAAPSGRYTATTDGKGFFSIAGVVPDTYTVSIVAPGFESLTISGVTVFQDQDSPVNQRLNKQLQNIGRTTTRSQSSAYQPSVPQDTYNVGPAAIQTQLGKRNNVSESSLLISLPGASLDSSGYPVLRGGRENEEGFQFEGIDYTDAFTSQFVNSLSLNNPGQFQLSPGAGDASSGNSGTGVVNLLTKRGTRPSFGSVDVEALGYPFTHQAAIEYGWATPNGRISNYTTFTGRNQNRIYGAFNSNTTDIGAFFSTQNVQSRDIINNFVYKFGRDNNQSLQLLYQNQSAIFNANAGGISGLTYKTADAYALSRIRTYTGLTTPQIQSGLIQLYPGQFSATSMLNDYSGSIQPNDTLKLQYTMAPDPSSFYSLKFYKVNAVTTFRRPFVSEDSQGNYYRSLQGGVRTGFGLDAQKQLGDKHLIKYGMKYDFLHPVFSYASPVYGAESIGPVFTNGTGEVKDFLPGGYLAMNGFTNQQIPVFQTTATTNRQDTAFYITDSWSPTSRVKADIGLREDISNLQIPDPAKNPELFAPGTTSVDARAKNPHILEPRIAVSYQMGRNDAVRASFARSVEFPPIADIDNQINRSYFQSLPYSQLPATQKVCGTTANQGAGVTCANYGEQLYWENQNFNAIPIQPARPETFTNYDFSYSHQFGGGVAMRLTPFYRRGYDALVAYATVRTNPATGAPLTDPVTGNFLFNPSIASNLGVNRTTGVELYITKDNPNPGFSGSVSATYINEFSNVIPLSASEDFFPGIPAASALLGNQYRVGFLSPFQLTTAIAYKTRSGFRFNPVVSYNVGYPINVGRLTSGFVGSTPFNLVNTNVTNSFGAGQAPAYVDPQNPGTVFNPNIAASRGTSQSNAAGGVLSAQRISANMAIEYTPKGATKGSTIGIFVSNVFNNLYGQPGINTRYQPVANGISGPQTGQIAQTLQFPGVGFGNYLYGSRFGNQPYIISPNNSPRTFNFYYRFDF